MALFLLFSSMNFRSRCFPCFVRATFSFLLYLATDGCCSIMFSFRCLPCPYAIRMFVSLAHLLRSLSRSMLLMQMNYTLLKDVTPHLHTWRVRVRLVRFTTFPIANNQPLDMIMVDEQGGSMHAQISFDTDKDQLLTPIATLSSQIDPLLPAALSNIAPTSSTGAPIHHSVLSSTPPDETAAEIGLTCQLMPSKDDASSATWSCLCLGPTVLLLSVFTQR